MHGRVKTESEPSLLMLLCNLLKEREESSGASRENPMSTCKMLVKNVWFIQESVINLV